MSEVESTSSDVSNSASDGAEMRARRWAIAAAREPATYGIPKVPEWVVCDESGLALADAPDSEAFIRAASPVQVRR